jgi:hypothetical protein
MQLINIDSAFTIFAFPLTKMKPLLKNYNDDMKNETADLRIKTTTTNDTFKYFGIDTI